ncbi:MAG: GNAT family N-acetyltransferase [Melioribacteraceae bacterium]|nr:GNAT family N-acetyltransferase [Melioribacteraceae bacterium]
MSVELREIKLADLDIIFRHWKDPDANHMAAFTAKNPNSRDEFNRHWEKILADEEIIIRVIRYNNEIVGHILSFLMDDERELSYWIDRKYWGKGIATISVKKFLNIVKSRPIFARTAFDNIASIKVLENSGFIKTGENIYFANAREKEIVEYIFELKK